MSSHARTVFEACKTTALTFDCYGTLIDWQNGACRALRDVYGYSRSEVSDGALIDLFLHAVARMIRAEVFPYSKVLRRVAKSIAESLQARSNSAMEASFAGSRTGLIAKACCVRDFDPLCCTGHSRISERQLPVGSYGREQGNGGTRSPGHPCVKLSSRLRSPAAFLFPHLPDIDVGSRVGSRCPPVE